MKAGARIWGVGWRLVVCALLMGWILNAIFTQEGRAALEREGISWAGLSLAERWHAAWAHGPHELWQALSSVRALPLAASFVCMGLTILLGVVRWRLVLGAQGLSLAFGRASEISLVAHFFNSFLLGSTGGDLMKAYYAARETHHRKTEAVVTVFVDRLLGLFTMLLFACLMMVPNRALLDTQPRLRLVALLVLAMMIGCGVVLTLAFRGGMSRLWPQARAWLRRLPKGDLLERSLNSCREIGQKPVCLMKAVALSMALNVAAVFQILFLASGMGLTVSPLSLFVIVPVIICLSALPITPSGLGLRENLYVLMLAAPGINVPATQALSLSLLAYAGSLLWSLMGGGVYASFRESHHLREITEAKPIVGAAV